jgi:hypothetical protein
VSVTSASKFNAFWDFMLCRLAKGYRHSKGRISFIFKLRKSKKSSIIRRNVGSYLAVNTAYIAEELTSTASLLGAYFSQIRCKCCIGYCRSHNDPHHIFIKALSPPTTPRRSRGLAIDLEDFFPLLLQFRRNKYSNEHFGYFSKSVFFYIFY